MAYVINDWKKMYDSFTLEWHAVLMRAHGVPAGADNWVCIAESEEYRQSVEVPLPPAAEGVPTVRNSDVEARQTAQTNSTH